jgi:hypothetical protein
LLEDAHRSVSGVILPFCIGTPSVSPLLDGAPTLTSATGRLHSYTQIYPRSCAGIHLATPQCFLLAYAPHPAAAAAAAENDDYGTGRWQAY